MTEDTDVISTDDAAVAARKAVLEQREKVLAARTAFEGIDVDDLSAIASLIPEFGESGAVYEGTTLFVPDKALAARVAGDLKNIKRVRHDAALVKLRAERDRRLAASDWTQLPDALTAEQRKEWAAYRKALRDLPKASDPFASVWPVSPAEKA